MHRNPLEQTGPVGVGGWLLVLCAVLLVWAPLNLALAGANALSALSFRGFPLAVMLSIRIIVAAIGIAAGIALAARRGPAVLLAKSSLILSAATEILVSSTTYFPGNRMPGDTAFYIAGTLGFLGGWFAYLVWSTRVRNTYE